MPTSLVDLINLEYLGLQKNNLQQLPEQLDQLQALRQLNAAHNCLRVLPRAIERLYALQFFTPRSQPIKTPCARFFLPLTVATAHTFLQPIGATSCFYWPTFNN